MHFFFFGIVVFRRTIRILMAWSLRVAGWLMHLFCDFLRVTGKFVFWWHDHCVSQDDQCHFFFFLRLLRVAGQFIFWFVIAMFCKAIHPLICNCCISQGNSSFEFWLLHFAKQFVFWFCNCYVSQGNSSFDLQLLHFAITMFRRAIHLLILRLLCFAGQFVF